ncbi:diacylglycerol/lipid kinase family protein [Phreatobacter sp. HK31-P]
MADKGIFGFGSTPSVAVLANRSSGLGGNGGQPVDAIVAAISAFGIYPHIYMARGGRLQEAIAACQAQTPDVVVVLGGDGTILAAAEAFAGTATALAIVPQGTVNQLARDLLIPLEPARAIAALASGDQRSIDVGMVNDHAFLCTSVIGPLAKLQRYREEARGRMGATVLSFLRTGMKAMTLRPAKLAIRDGRSAWTEETRGVIVSVNPLAEIVSRVPFRERLDAGLLAVYAARERGYLTLFRLAASIFAGRARHDADIGYCETPVLAIDTQREWLTILNDGEIRRVKTPLRFEVRPGALKVIVPRPPDPAA